MSTAFAPLMANLFEVAVFSHWIDCGSAAVIAGQSAFIAINQQLLRGSQCSGDATSVVVGRAVQRLAWDGVFPCCASLMHL